MNLAGVKEPEAEARQRYADVRIFTIQMSCIARAVELDESRGFTKVGP
jgi:pyruvate/2-oxoglutarate dehydrogenase complex dihydrolipoamide dehydrogenase (E3) component